jgi:hypothetical protein
MMSAQVVAVLVSALVAVTATAGAALVFRFVLVRTRVVAAGPACLDVR